MSCPDTGHYALKLNLVVARLGSLLPHSTRKFIDSTSKYFEVRYFEVLLKYFLKSIINLALLKYRISGYRLVKLNLAQLYYNLILNLVGITVTKGGGM